MIQLSVAVRNRRLNAIEDEIGPDAVIKIFANGARGGPPPDSDFPDDEDAVVLATLLLPSDWLQDAQSGLKSMRGLWQDDVDQAGDVGHFRVYSADGVPGMQGTCSLIGGTGDLVVDAEQVQPGEYFTMELFQLAEANE